MTPTRANKKRARPVLLCHRWTRVLTALDVDEFLCEGFVGWTHGGATRRKKNGEVKT